MSTSSILLAEADKLPSLIGELALYPQEKWVEHTIGKSEDIHGNNLILREIYKELDELRWLKETTSYLFCRTERIREIQRIRGGILTEFAYIPVPGLKNGKRIKHPCELSTKNPIDAVLTQAPAERSRELAWIIPYKTSTGEKTLVFILTFDPLTEIKVRTTTSDWDKCIQYWKNALEDQGMSKAGESLSFLHAFTGLHEWMNILETRDGEQAPQYWKRHAISPQEASHGATRGLDIYYSNSIVAYAWSTLEKQRGRERARMLLQQDLCKRVVLFDPIYGRSQGSKSPKTAENYNFLVSGDTEREKMAKSFWDNTIGSAHSTGASDIHIEPMQVVGRSGCDLIVSLRKDGQLNFHTRVPSELSHDYCRFALETSGIIKEELKRPQDGRRSWINPVTKEAIDLRVSVTPVGAPIQKIVMRLLDTNKLKKGITDIGLEPDEIRLWEKALTLNQGLVLVSGPTGSGKCVRQGTRIRTNKGLIPIESIIERHEKKERFTTQTINGWEPITNTFRCGIKEILRIETKTGTVLEIAPTHPLLTTDLNLQPCWQEAQNYNPGDALLFHAKTPIEKNGDWNKYWLYGVWIGNNNTTLHKQSPSTKKNSTKTCPEYLRKLKEVLNSQSSQPVAWKKQKGVLILKDPYLCEGVISDNKGYAKNIPNSLWQATPYEIAGFISGWIDSNGQCQRNKIEIVTKEEAIAKNTKTILASVGINAHLSKKVVKKNTYWKLCIKKTRNLQRLIQLGTLPIDNRKRAKLLKCVDIPRKTNNVRFPVTHLKRLQTAISEAVEQAYGPQSKRTRNTHLNIVSTINNTTNNTTNKFVKVDTLKKIFQLFPNALPLLPNIQIILENDLEPEIIKSVVRTGKYEEMYDIEVGVSHTYQIEGLICHNSTTLYAALLSIFQRDTRRSFATIEDPVEYRLPFRSTQSPVNESKGASYENLIRQAMRNDGDTFLVGEIRDTATANATLQLALTGHQVLSSIHANSAPETALRLLELGVDAYTLSETLKMVVAQRLVPTCCPYCKKQLADSEVPTLLRKYGGEILLETYNTLWERKYKKRANWIKGEGCPQCQFTGLSGLTAAQEFLVIDHKNKKFLKEANIEKLEESMKEKSLLRMEEVVWKFAWQGRIPIDQAGELTNQLKTG